MLVAFVVGVPFSTAACAGFFGYGTKDRFLKAFGAALTTLVITVLLAIPIFHEGTICVAMLLGIAILPTMLGAALGAAIAYIRTELRGTLMSIIAIAPFLLGSAEQHYRPQDVVHEVTRSVLIQAAPDKIWQMLLNPSNIKPSEFEKGWAYKIGAPYPVQASTVEPKVGGMRKSVWQRGVNFDEEITAIEPARYIEWIYHFTDASFPPGSLDDHVKIGGSYFDLKNTSYRIRPTAQGTYLDISVKYRVTTDFNWYAAPLAVFFVRNTEDTLLNFYKARSEAGGV